MSAGCGSSSDAKTNQKNTALSVSAPQFNQAQQSNVEAVNFIAQNNTTGQVATLPTSLVPTYDTTGQATIGPPPAAPDGWSIVAFTHTHPTNYIGTANPTGVDSLSGGALPYVNLPGQNYPAYTNTFFSVSDLVYANNYALDAYVEVYAAPSAAMAAGGTATYNWGAWAHGGTIGQTNNYTSGSMGATSQWNNC